jgi:GAF domain-containing protein
MPSFDPLVSAKTSEITGEANKGQWSPGEYVLYGRYCEPEAISARLDALRNSGGAEAALLIANRGQTLFHSLLLVSHRDPTLAASLQKRLLDRPRWPGLQELPLTDYRDVEDLGPRLFEHPPFVRAPEIFEHRSLDVLRCDGRPSASDAVAPLASIHVLFAGATIEDLPEVAGVQLDELLMMVNASAPVVVHGSLHVERLFDARLDTAAGAVATVTELSDEDIDDPQALRSIAQALLNEALDLTRSSLGNIYFADRDGEHLRLVAHRRNVRIRGSIRMDEADSVVAWVYDRRRPLVINDIADFQRLHPSAGPLDVSGDERPPYAELAVPIVQHSLSSRGSTVLGVVNVEKLQSVDEDRFTYRDLTLLHSVANRLALWRAHAMLRYTAASLAVLTRRNAAPADIAAAQSETEGLDLRVPSDAALARPIIDETLQRIYSLTRSHSATVRLLSPDRRWLMRFSAYPPERMTDPEPDIGIHDDLSMVAWVAREGRACHLANVKNTVELSRHHGLNGPLLVREGTRSELCLPVFVSGRLVGALNLESRFRDGYVDSMETAAAVAEQVGLALQYARRSHEQTVMSMSTASTANVHELAKAVDALRALAQEPHVHGDLATTIREISDHVARCIHSGTTLAQEPGIALSQLLDDVLRELKLQAVVVVRGRPKRDLLLRGGDALSLRVALTALFDNAKNSLHNTNPRLEARWSKHSVGGRDYVTLLIGNTIGLERPARTLRLLFRQPLREEESDRVHIGAFTAAALVRSIGGDVFVHRSAPPCSSWASTSLSTSKPHKRRLQHDCVPSPGGRQRQGRAR